MLFAVMVPEVGGATELADMRAGYGALDQATKFNIADLSAYHSTQCSLRPNSPQEEEGALFYVDAYLRPLKNL